VIDEEALRLAEIRQRKLEEEREAQARVEAALKLKTQKHDDLSIDRFFKRQDPEPTAPPAVVNGEEEEERERTRILRSVSGMFSASKNNQCEVVDYFRLVAKPSRKRV
jgi:hypothetical protein